MPIATIPPQTVSRDLDLDSTGTLVLSARSGVITGWNIYNDDAAIVFVKIYDKATIATASDTPILTIPILQDTQSDIGGLSIRCLLGISWRVTTAIADASTADVQNDNDVIGNLFFYPT